MTNSRDSDLHESGIVAQAKRGLAFDFNAASEGRLIPIRPLAREEEGVYTVAQLTAGLHRESSDAVRDSLIRARNGDPEAQWVIRDLVKLLVVQGGLQVRCTILMSDETQEPLLEVSTRETMM